MPPKRKRSTNLDESGAEGLAPEGSVQEDGGTAPKKRGRKSMIDAILQEEARGSPAPVLPQNQWTVSIVHSQDSAQTANTTKRRKVQPATPSLATQKHPPPGTPSVWATNKSDFYSSFKSLAESFAGISFANLGTFPVLAWLVEGPRSPEDTLDGEKLTLSLVTEFKPKDEPGVSTSAAGQKKKGRQNRRTKRGDLTTVSTDLVNSANMNFSSNTHVGTNPPHEDLKSAPQKQRPCLVPSEYNPNYPTFCECLQPQCPRHCPVAKDLIFRRCTEYSWPHPDVIASYERSILLEPRASCDAGAQTGEPKNGPSASFEHEPEVQGQDPSTSIPTSSSLLPLGTTKMYAQVVPELGSLLDHMERKDPILVISTNDAPILPFQLPPEYGCVVLGFFDVDSVECENGNHPLTSSIQPGTLSWKVRLRYTSPSDSKDGNGNLAPPWWSTPPTKLARSGVAGPSSSPPAPVPEPGKRGVEGEADGWVEAPVLVDRRWCVVQALEGNQGRTWWHCLGCGRINHRDMLLHRRCPSCKRNEAPSPPFVIEEVLQDSSTAPYPFNHAPRSMKPGDISVKEFHDMTNVYHYNFHDEPPPVGAGSEKGACVKHIFTGAYESLKIQATGLFYQIQEGVEMSWQGAKSGIAEGPYYSWASPRHGWIDDEIPKCVDEARRMISKSVKNYCEKDPGGKRDLEDDGKAGPSVNSDGTGEEEGRTAEDIRINHFVALAWTGSGSKRGTFVSAKENPVFVLSLGAPVELELERWLPDTATEENPPVIVFQEAVEEEPGQKAKGKKPRKSQKQAATPEIKVNAKGSKKDKGKEKSTVSQPKPKPSAPAHEKLKISMVHGDVLVLSGGDFIYSLTRSGMSIVLFGMADVQ